jgi:hypothetical protein
LLFVVNLQADPRHSSFELFVVKTAVPPLDALVRPIAPVLLFDNPTVNVGLENVNAVFVPDACVPAVPSTTPPFAKLDALVTQVVHVNVPLVVIVPPPSGAVVAMLVTVPAGTAPPSETKQFVPVTTQVSR